MKKELLIEFEPDDRYGKKYVPHHIILETYITEEEWKRHVYEVSKGLQPTNLKTKLGLI